jgi:hypothetical protein
MIKSNTVFICKRSFLFAVIAFFVGVACLSAQPKIIKWDSLGQQVTLDKSEMYYMMYRNGLSSDWTYIDVETDSKDSKKHIFTLKTLSVARPDTVLLPDTLYMPCRPDGEVDFVYTGVPTNQEMRERALRNARTIIINKIGQVDTVLYCEKVSLVYDRIQKEDCEIVYEQGPDCYYLRTINYQKMTPIKFNCICQKFYLSNPWMKQITFVEELKYEQIIMTPMANGLWEVRIGTTNRGCDSKALDKLPKLRDREYERNLPDCK